MNHGAVMVNVEKPNDNSEISNSAEMCTED